MGWGNKFPDLKNDPSYLDPRLTAAEQSLAQKTTQLTDISISVKDYGAKGDWNGTTGTDDSQAIINCATYCRTNGYTLFIPETMQCKVTRQIDLTNIAVNMQGKIIVDNTVFTSGIAVLLGNTQANFLENRKLVVNVKNSTKNLTNIVTGVQIKNAYRCDIIIKSIKYFKTGLQVTSQSDGTNPIGNGWNKYNIIQCSDNDINLVVDTMDAVAWTNENTFYGGDLQGANTTGIIIGTTNSTWKAPNHNTFIQPDLSTCTTQVQFLSGIRNRLESIRCELATNIAQFEVLAFNNIVTIGWDTNIHYTDNAKNGTNKVLRTDNTRNYFSVLEPNAFKYAYFEGDGVTLHVPNFSIRHYATSSVYRSRNVNTEGVVINPNYIQLTHWDAIGVRVSTKHIKNFKLSAQSAIAEDASNIRFILIPFDSSGNRLTASGLVQGARWLDRSNQTYTTTNYGGAFMFIPPTSSYEFPYGISEGYVCVDPTVDSIWVGVAGTDSTHFANVAGFNIFVDTPILPNVYPDYSGNIEYPSRQDVLKGTTAQRPTTPRQGQQYMDTTLNANGKPIMYNGTAWVDYTGATV